MGGRRRRSRAEHTDEWEQIELLCAWPEQRDYELIRPLVLFGDPVAERADETGTSERTLYRRASAFGAEGMESLLGSETAGRRRLPPAMRRLVVDLKAEHPALNLSEISRICYARFGRRPDERTVRRVLEEEPLPLRMIRRYPPYREIPEERERRAAVVALHAEGWTVKAIASYLSINRDTAYVALKRWIEEGGEAGLEDRPRGRPPGVRKVDMRAIAAVRKLQENPELGEFRVHAALAQIGIHLSPRTCGRILALNRALYGLEKPSGGGGRAKTMPFASGRRHEFWTADVRYLDAIDEHELGGRAYVVSILENHGRAILASAVSPTQDLSAFLSVLYRAVERYGAPEALVTDGGSVFRANQAKAVYEAAGVAKHEIERGKPWQSYVETTFNIQRRMADWHFARARSWPELVAVHDRFVEDYNAERHWAHRGREDGRLSPAEVLGWVTGLRYRPEDLERAFFASRFSRDLDALGYATFRRWRLYGEEALAGREAALRLHAGSLTLEHEGRALSRYDVERAAGTDRLASVARPRLFQTPYALVQPRLFRLDEAVWLKALKLDDYAARKLRRPSALQGVLFSYLDAL